MVFGVFIHRSDSIYDDSPSEQYQFPSIYLGRVSACVADWIIYYEPRKVPGTRGYFAMAKVASVVPDPTADGMYLALIEPGSYLDFANPVPFRNETGVIELGVLNAMGQISGRTQSAVRPISASDFHRIIDLGLNPNDALLPRSGETRDGFSDSIEPVPFEHPADRMRVEYLVSRAVRDRVFRRVVLRAYDERCAVTGIKLINGGGRAEVEAAHIRSVEANGPDIVSNGIALCGTAHWMFDRGLISLADDLTILISRHANDPGSIKSMVNSTGIARLPERRSERPHPHFLNWHRENCFKQ